MSTNTSNTENYYDFIKDDCHFFMLDTGDDNTESSLGIKQESWLRSTIKLSKSKWQIVVLHHAPYSSYTKHGSHKNLQIDYENMGIDIVYAGHDHVYERIHKDDNNDGIILPYFISGCGGKSLYDFGDDHIDGSQVRYSDDYGSMLVKVKNDSIIHEFWNRKGNIIDQYLQVSKY